MLQCEHFGAFDATKRIYFNCSRTAKDKRETGSGDSPASLCCPRNGQHHHDASPIPAEVGGQARQTTALVR